MIPPQNYYTAQLFQTFKPSFRKIFLHNCPKEFIRFLCECCFNLLAGKLNIKKSQVFKFERQLKRLISKSTSLRERRSILSSPKGLKLISMLIPVVTKKVDKRE